jgi:hypothetical protein
LAALTRPVTWTGVRKEVYRRSGRRLAIEGKMSTGQVYMAGLFGVPVEEGRECANECVADEKESCPCKP